MATAEPIVLMTAEEFCDRPDPGHPEELVRGRIADFPVSDRLHGYVCGRIAYRLSRLTDAHDFGRVLCRSGIITERGPDTVRGADVCVYSFARLPRGPLAPGYGPEVPELVVEVLSQHDRWRDVHEKIGEYLHAGVTLALILDPSLLTAHLFRPDLPPLSLSADAELTLPPPFDAFRERVGRFFE